MSNMSDKAHAIRQRNRLQQLFGPGVYVDDDYDSSGNYKYKSIFDPGIKVDDDKGKFLLVKPLDGEVFTLDTDDETTVSQVMQKIHDMSEYHNMRTLDLMIGNMDGKDWGIAGLDLKISELNLQEENTVRLFTHRLEQHGFVKGYEAALKGKDKDIVSDKSKVGKGKDTGSSNDKKPEIYSIATPEECMPPIIVISLLNTSEGKSRRSKLNMKHELFTAFHWEDSEPHTSIEVTGRAQESTGTKPRQRATFYSHYMVWKQVAEGSINTIIAEDDAILVRDIDLTILSDDCITLLGGCIRTPGTWNREMAEFVETMKFLDIVKNFKPGLNNIDYDNFRWTNCLAYYLPVEVAKILVKKVEATRTSSGKFGVKPVDIWLGESGWVKQLIYPNPFMDMDDSKTQANSPKGHQKADHYICEYMRKSLSMKQGINLSARGVSTLLAE